MRHRALWILLLAMAVVLLATGVGTAQETEPPGSGITSAQIGTAFTYQGYLTDNDSPVDGSVDLKFALYDSATGGQALGEVLQPAVLVTDGLFTVKLDFGSNLFSGTNRYLEISVREAGGDDGVYTTLSPRQEITPAPYAVFAAKAPWSGLADIPADIADGDADTQYVAGTGLSLAGTTFEIRPEYRLPMACSANQIPKWTGTSWTCGDDNVGSGDAVSGTDCTVIQQAIDNLPAEGGQVLVAAGTFHCSSPIVIDRDNVKLQGQGPGTVLHLNDNANSPVIVIGNTTTPPAVVRSHIQVTDLTIDGNRANQTVECWGGDCNSGPFPIRNNGITVRGVEDVHVERVTVSGAISGGLVVEKNSRRLAVRDFTSYDNRYDGLAGYETQDSVFSGLYLHDNDGAGLSFDIDFNNNLISDSVIAASGTVGIFMRDSRHNVFQSLQIRDSDEHGIFLAQVDLDTSTPASGNVFADMVVSGSAGAGLHVNNASCVNNLVCASQFTGNTGGGISEVTSGLVQICGNVESAE